MSEFSVAITTLEIQHKRKKANRNSAQFPLNNKDDLTIFALIQDRLITDSFLAVKMTHQTLSSLVL